jgi:hypothetical protein
LDVRHTPLNAANMYALSSMKELLMYLPISFQNNQTTPNPLCLSFAVPAMFAQKSNPLSYRRIRLTNESPVHTLTHYLSLPIAFSAIIVVKSYTIYSNKKFRINHVRFWTDPDFVLISLFTHFPPKRLSNVLYDVSSIQTPIYTSH